VVGVGGAGAGAGVAARVSEDPLISVCLIESGPSDRNEPRALELRRSFEMLEGEYEFDYRSVPQIRGNLGRVDQHRPVRRAALGLRGRGGRVAGQDLPGERGRERPVVDHREPVRRVRCADAARCEPRSLAGPGDDRRRLRAGIGELPVPELLMVEVPLRAGLAEWQAGYATLLRAEVRDLAVVGRRETSRGGQR
jgi:choline dehydrogenase-like flavoprotein